MPGGDRDREGQSRHRSLPQQAAPQRSQLKLKQTIKLGRWRCAAGPRGRRGRTEVPEDKVSASSLLHLPQPLRSLAVISCLPPTPLNARGTPHPSWVLSHSSFLPGRSSQVPDFFHLSFPARRQGRLGGPASQRHQRPSLCPGTRRSCRNGAGEHLAARVWPRP